MASTSSASTTVTMSGPQTVTANFVAIPRLTIQTIPAGLLFSVDGGLPQTAPQTMTLTAGSHTIAVAATQSGGAGTQYVFNSWSDGGAASHSINVSGPATYTASFQTQYQLTLAASPAAGGTVAPNSGIFYNSAAVVVIAATAINGYSFANWSGSVASTGSPFTTVTMNGPQTVTANFSLPSCSFSLNSPGISLPAIGTSSNGFAPSAPQSFTLTPNAGCNGVSWSATTADVSPASATPSAFVSIASGASGSGAGADSRSASMPSPIRIWRRAVPPSPSPRREWRQ